MINTIVVILIYRIFLIRINTGMKPAFCVINAEFLWSTSNLEARWIKSTAETVMMLSLLADAMVVVKSLELVRKFIIFPNYNPQLK